MWIGGASRNSPAQRASSDARPEMKAPMLDPASTSGRGAAAQRSSRRRRRNAMSLTLPAASMSL
jgi:hypothetical protein